MRCIIILHQLTIDRKKLLVDPSRCRYTGSNRIISSKKAELTKPDAEKKMSSEGAHSLEFVSSKYDDLVAFKDEAVKQIKQLFTRVAEISILCDRIAKSIDTLEAYSYQFK